MISNDSIISIHPRYAHAILDGDKTVELRRRIPHIKNGDRLWIYSTLPEGAVIGSVYVEEVLRLPPETLWKRYGTKTKVNYETFEKYFHDSELAIGIVLKKPNRRPPIMLAELRQIRPNFQPPQVLQRLGKPFQNHFLDAEIGTI